jgi:hypothetical protein
MGTGFLILFIALMLAPCQARKIKGAFYFNQTEISASIPYDYPLDKEIINLSPFIRRSKDFDTLSDTYRFLRVKSPFRISLDGVLTLRVPLRDEKSPYVFKVEALYPKPWNNISLEMMKFFTKVKVHFTGMYVNVGESHSMYT